MFCSAATINVRYILFLSLLLVSTLTSAQSNLDAESIPTALRSRANAIIRSEETIVDMQSPNEVNLLVKKVVTVMNDNGNHAAFLALFYDKNTIVKTVRGELYDEFGRSVAKISSSQFRDESAVQEISLFDDSRVKYFRPTANSYPYTIVYQYEIKFKQNLIIPDWRPKVAADIAVEKSTYTFIAKQEDQFRIQSKNYAGIPSEIINEKEKRKTIIWKVENLPAVKPEPFSPNPENYLTSIKIAPQHFTYFKYQGTYTNWHELGKWSYDNLLKGRDVLPQATVAHVQALVGAEPTEKAKAKKIYKFLQNKTRYISVQIGIGGFQPVPAAEVDRLGYGDCKGLVNYMYSLLKAVGIESYYCVVEGNREKISLDPTYASMSQGNHIILCLPLKGDTTWLECTDQQIPFGYLGKFTDDRYVLACTPEGGKLLKTPKFSIEKSLQHRQGQLRLHHDGNVSGRLKTVFTGSQYSNHEHIVNKSITEQQKLLKEVYDVDNINFDQISYQQNKTIEPALTEVLDLQIKNFGSSSGNRIFLQINPFNVMNNVTEVKNRTLPVYINRGFVDVDTIVYEISDQLELLTVPTSTRINNEFGSYEATSRVSGNQLTYTRKFTLKEGTFPPSSYTTFSKFIADVNAADHLKMVFSLKK